ncbi:MAG: hypothetical protein WCR52_05580 [Bacteroidota bacterium]
MRTILLLLSATAVVFLFFCCEHTKYTAANLPADQLRWGSGGGIVGKETTYTLLENGQFFKRDGIKADLMELAPIKARQANALVESAEKLGLLKMDFAHPGNTYQFIEFEDDGKKSRVSWGDPKFPVDGKVQELYKKLSDLIKN